MSTLSVYKISPIYLLRIGDGYEQPSDNDYLEPDQMLSCLEAL